MCLGGTCVLVFEPRIHVSYSGVVASSRCIVASSWRSGELILKHFVAVVRFIKDYDQGKGKAYRTNDQKKIESSIIRT